MDKTVEKMLQRREIEEQLEGLRSKRVGLLAERETARQQRSNLELKRARAEHGVQEEVERTSKAIVGLDARISGLRARDSSEGDFRKLKEERMAAYRRRSELRARLDVGEVLEGEDARLLGDLDDRIDSLEAELEYLDEQAAETERDLRGLDMASQQLQRRVAEGTLEEARGMMSSFMRTMVEVRNKERQDAARLCELELQASERAQAIERAESNLRLKDFEYERRVTELQKDHAHKVQDLLSQLAVAQQEQDDAAGPGQAPGPGRGSSLRFCSIHTLSIAHKKLHTNPTRSSNTRTWSHPSNSGSRQSPSSTACRRPSSHYRPCTNPRHRGRACGIFLPMSPK